MSKDNSLRKAIQIQINYLRRTTTSTAEIQICRTLEAILGKADQLDASEQRRSEDISLK